MCRGRIRLLEVTLPIWLPCCLLLAVLGLTFDAVQLSWGWLQGLSPWERVAGAVAAISFCAAVFALV